MVRFLFQCPITKTGNLYSALPDSPGSRQNLVRCDTKERYNSRGLASQSRAQQTVATYFRYSLMDLLQKMVAGAPQFVRCIKPNETRAPRCFEGPKVLKQLRYTGVLETIRIRQHGFSHRFTFAEFVRRYGTLAFGWEEMQRQQQQQQQQPQPQREQCRILLMRLKLDGWALGKSKVFLKYYHVEFLSKMFEEQSRKVILVQACVRRWLARVRYGRTRSTASASAVTLQRHVRGWLTRRRLLVERERERVEREREDKERRRRAHAEEALREKESKAKMAAAKAKILRKLHAPEAQPFDSRSDVRRVGSRETLGQQSPQQSQQSSQQPNDRAAAVIQSRKPSHPTSRSHPHKTLHNHNPIDRTLSHTPLK